jgi:hypothetical protein
LGQLEVVADFGVYGEVAVILVDFGDYFVEEELLGVYQKITMFGEVEVIGNVLRCHLRNPFREYGYKFVEEVDLGCLGCQSHIRHYLFVGEG